MNNDDNLSERDVQVVDAAAERFAKEITLSEVEAREAGSSGVVWCCMLIANF